MLKIRVLYLAPILIALASCKQNSDSPLIIEQDPSFRVNVTLEEAELTRAAYLDSALGGLENIDLTGDKTIRYILEASQDGSAIAARYVKFSDKKSASFDVRLAPGRNYKFVVWADIVNGPTDEDVYYDTSDLRDIRIISDKRIMNEYCDAFTGYHIAKNFNSTTGINIKLVRPFAKLRIITTDMDIIEDYGYKANYGKVAYSIGAPQSFNAYEGRVNDAKLTDVQSFAIADYTSELDTNGDLVSGRKTIYSDYIFANYEPTEIAIDLTIRDTDMNQDITSISIDNGIPIARNTLTTVVGRMLTDGYIEGLYTPITPDGGDEF